VWVKVHRGFKSHRYRTLSDKRAPDQRERWSGARLLGITALLLPGAAGRPAYADRNGHRAVRSWLDAGAVAVGIGDRSDLIGGGMATGNFDTVRTSVREWLLSSLAARSWCRSSVGAACQGPGCPEMAPVCCSVRSLKTRGLHD
jgi:hypothetical protein